MYEPPFPSYSSTPSPARRRHLLAPTILSLFSFPFFALSLRSMYARVSARVYVRACTRYVCKILGVRECARERRKENEWDGDGERLTRECGTERKGGARGGGARSEESETLEWEIIKMAARATYSTSYSSATAAYSYASIPPLRSTDTPPRAQTARRIAARDMYNSNGLP